MSIFYQLEVVSRSDDTTSSGQHLNYYWYFFIYVNALRVNTHSSHCDLSTLSIKDTGNTIN